MVIKKFKKKVKGEIFFGNYCLASFNLLYDVNYLLFFFAFGMEALAICVVGVYALYELLLSDCSSDYFFFNSPKNKETFEAWVKLQKPLILSPSEKSAFAGFSGPVKPLAEALFFVEPLQIQTNIPPRFEDVPLNIWDDYLKSLKYEQSMDASMKKDAPNCCYALILLACVVILLCGTK